MKDNKMKKFFYDLLRENIGADDDLKGPIFNRKFLGWERCINDSLENKCPERDDDRYFLKPDRELFRICEEHAKKHIQLLDIEEAVILTHPFYMFLSHAPHNDLWKGKQGPYKEEAAGYISRLMAFLEERKKKKDKRVIALEIPHYYAAATSLLMERELVNETIFTERNYGHPLETSDLRKLKRNKIYICGSYWGLCINQSILALGSQECKDVWALEGIVLRHPGYVGSIIQKGFEYSLRVRGGVDPKNI